MSRDHTKLKIFILADALVIRTMQSFMRVVSSEADGRTSGQAD